MLGRLGALFGYCGVVVFVTVFGWPELGFVANAALVGSAGKLLLLFENMLGVLHPIDITPANSKPVQALVVKVIIRELPMDGHTGASCSGAVSP